MEHSKISEIAVKVTAAIVLLILILKLAMRFAEM